MKIPRDSFIKVIKNAACKPKESTHFKCWGIMLLFKFSGEPQLDWKDKKKKTRKEKYFFFFAYPRSGKQIDAISWWQTVKWKCVNGHCISFVIPITWHFTFKRQLFYEYYLHEYLHILASHNQHDWVTWLLYIFTSFRLCFVFFFFLSFILLYQYIVNIRNSSQKWSRSWCYKWIQSELLNIWLVLHAVKLKQPRKMLPNQ